MDYHKTTNLFYECNRVIIKAVKNLTNKYEIEKTFHFKEEQSCQKNSLLQSAPGH